MLEDARNKADTCRNVVPDKVREGKAGSLLNREPDEGLDLRTLRS